jgi:hypothetical protein
VERVGGGLHLIPDDKKEDFMFRTMAAALVAVVSGGGLWADELNGQVKKVDADKNTLTLTVEDTDMTLTVDKEAKVRSLVGKGKKATYQAVDGGLKVLKVDTKVLVLREKKDGQDVVTDIKIVTDQVKKKKKQKNKLN